MSDVDDDARKLHRLRHVMLHQHLDELLADFIRHTGRFPSQTNCLELAQWSYDQAQEPTEVPEGVPFISLGPVGGSNG